MLKMYLCALCRYVCIRLRHRYSTVLWLIAALSLGLLGFAHISTYYPVNGRDIDESKKDFAYNELIDKNHGDKSANVENKKNDSETEDPNAFAKKMLTGLLRRQRSRRYEFVNLSETVYTTLRDVTHKCAEGEPPIKQYSKWFRNFCWFENDCGCNEQPSMLRCFPRFHLIGFPKAGTTDLYMRLMGHPQILETDKETNYWSVVRFAELGNETEKIRGFDTRAHFTEEHITNLENASVIHKGIQPYLDFYLKPLRIIEADFGYSPNQRKFAGKMFGEGSVTYAYSSLGLRISIGHQQNKSPMEVDCNIAKIIRWLTPEAKIIVSLRDPVERLYSDYRNLYRGLNADNKTASDFHKRVINRINMWKECVSMHSEDYCINSPQFEAVSVHSAIIGLVRSMYVLHLRKWLKEFPMEQVFIVHFEERVAEGKRIISDIVDFLELEPFHPELLEKIVNRKALGSDNTEKRLPHQAGRKLGPMLNATRELLQEFYRPYNHKLAEFLNDEKYLWYDSKKQFKINETENISAFHESLKK